MKFLLTGSRTPCRLFSALLLLLAFSSPCQSQESDEPLPSDCLTAMMYLTAPAGTPEQVPDEDRWKGISLAVQHIAIRWQIMDKRECNYIMKNRDDFVNDLEFLRSRYQEFKDMPLVEECFGRFPPANQINNCLQFNRAFHKNLETRLVWEQDRAPLIRQVMDENDWAYKVWNTMRDCQNDMQYITYRRQAIQKYKDLVGKKRWDDWEIPDYVPIWRFQQR